MMTSMYTVTMNVVMTVRVLPNMISPAIPTWTATVKWDQCSVSQIIVDPGSRSSMQEYLGLCVQCKLPVLGSKS